MAYRQVRWAPPWLPHSPQVTSMSYDPLPRSLPGTEACGFQYRNLGAPCPGGFYSGLVPTLPPTPWHWASGHTDDSHPLTVPTPTDLGHTGWLSRTQPRKATARGAQPCSPSSGPTTNPAKEPLKGPVPPTHSWMASRWGEAVSG